MVKRNLKGYEQNTDIVPYSIYGVDYNYYS